MRTVPYPHPGEILLEEFLKPMGITQYRVAKEISVPQRRIGEIVAGTRALTADTGLRLSRFFGMSDGFWIGLQVDYDTAKAKVALAKTLAKIKPWPPAANGPRAIASASEDHPTELSTTNARSGKNEDAFFETCGVWRREESSSQTVRMIRGAFRRSMKRRHT
jgi:addiction module HigA family antidote